MHTAPALSFETFARTAANAAAIDAARRVADDRADAPALLVLHGPAGSGKTHLLAAVGASRAAAARGAAVGYLSLAEPQEAARCAAADLVLVDDAHRAAHDAAACDALARLLEAGKPGRCVVLATSEPAAAIAGAHPRLARLLAAAPACPLAAPDPVPRPRATAADAARSVAAALGGRITPAFADAHATFAPPPAPDALPGVTAAGDFASFLSDVTAAVAQHVEPWKQRLAEASSRWGARGYAVHVLERALARATPPDVDGLLATFAAAVEHLARLEAQAAAIDPAAAAAPAFRDPARVADAESALSQLLPPAPDACHTRATVVESASNRAALEAADGVVAAPARDRNPLYLHGPSGSGRTHLVAAAANALRALRVGRVGYVCAPQLAEELAAAVRANAVDRWRARYTGVDVLAVDDVHELAGNARAEEELARVCATLRERGRQVLLAGEADPDAERGMGAALRAEIRRGRAAPLDAPDRDLRARLLEGYFAAARRAVDPDVAGYVAERLEPSAHRVAPLAERLLAAADRTGGVLTLAVARAELGRTPARTPLSAVIAGVGRTDAFFLDPEKVVLDWPEPTGRMIEELR